MAIIAGPLISLETEAEIIAELEGANNGKWEQLVVEIQDEGETILISFIVSDRQGDDDENVESILELVERVMTAKIPEKVPILSNGLSWSASVGYGEAVGEWRGVKGYLINTTGGGDETKEPVNRPRHGSPDDIDDELNSGRLRARWLARRVARQMDARDM